MKIPGPGTGPSLHKFEGKKSFRYLNTENIKYLHKENSCKYFLTIFAKIQQSFLDLAGALLIPIFF